MKALSFGNIRAGVSPETDGRSIEPSGAFQLLVLGDFSGRANRRVLETGSALASRRPWKIDRDNFDEVFERLNILAFLSLFESKKESIAALKNPDVGGPSLSEFVSSFSNKLFHFSYCSDIKKLEEETRLYYMSRENAQSGGKKPCPKCKP